MLTLGKEEGIVQARTSLSPLIWLEKALSGRANQDTQDDVWECKRTKKEIKREMEQRK